MRTIEEKTYDLIIAGAGPVGLLAGVLACRHGLDVLILEKQEKPLIHSRSIGIHPPSLRIFSDAGLLDAFLEKGLMIRRGQAISHRRTALGLLDIYNLRPPFNYILTIPQWISESILTEYLNKERPGALQRGVAVTGLSADDKSGLAARFGEILHVETEEPVTGRTRLFRTRMLLGCDGKKSTVRSLAGIPFDGGPYPYHYAMGDFTDNTDYGRDAVIFLGREGLVESFPLPGGTRRWVIQQDPGRPADDAVQFSEQVCHRCGMAPDPGACTMFSTFGVERFAANPFWIGQVALAGDAAHVVSPIGGQGMNLGWINAADVVALIALTRQGSLSIEAAARKYNKRGRKRAKKVIRRAEFNMMLGNRRAAPAIRDKLVTLLLGSPLRRLLRHRFTMQGI